MTECNCHIETGECQGPVDCKAIAEVERLRKVVQKIANLPICEMPKDKNKPPLTGRARRIALAALRGHQQYGNKEE